MRPLEGFHYPLESGALVRLDTGAQGSESTLWELTDESSDMGSEYPILRTPYGYLGQFGHFTRLEASSRQWLPVPGDVKAKRI